MKTKLWTLLPFVIFISVFLGFGIYFDDFYAIPSPVAIFIGVISAFIMFPGRMKTKVSTFLKGCGEKNILTMCMVYLLAGAFATTAEAVGSVDAVVNIGIHYLSPEYYTVGVFILASFLSIASGSSVGTIAAVGPIAVSLAATTGVNINIIGAALLGGAMFGDNLSIISDTTIAATQILGCKMSDKFRTNVKFVFPAAILTILLYAFIVPVPDQVNASEMQVSSTSFIAVIPYLTVLILAFLGGNVFAVLFIGILLSGAYGFIFTDLSFLAFSDNIYEGFKSMNEIFLLSLLTGGLAYMVEKAGGIRSLIEFIKKRISKPRNALYGIGAFVGLTDAATANNTISIIISGKVAREITEEYGLKRKITASVLDTFSCVIQGVLPYGAQILILISLSKHQINLSELLKYHYYIYFLLIAAILFIFLSTLKKKYQLPNKVKK